MDTPPHTPLHVGVPDNVCPKEVLSPSTSFSLTHLVHETRHLAETHPFFSHFVHDVLRHTTQPLHDRWRFSAQARLPTFLWEEQENQKEELQRAARPVSRWIGVRYAFTAWRHKRWPTPYTLLVSQRAWKIYYQAMAEERRGDVVWFTHLLQHWGMPPSFFMHTCDEEGRLEEWELPPHGSLTLELQDLLEAWLEAMRAPSETVREAAIQEGARTTTAREQATTREHTLKASTASLILDQAASLHEVRATDTSSATLSAFERSLAAPKDERTIEDVLIEELCAVNEAHVRRRLISQRCWLILLPYMTTDYWYQLKARVHEDNLWIATTYALTTAPYDAWGLDKNTLRQHARRLGVLLPSPHGPQI